MCLFEQIFVFELFDNNDSENRQTSNWNYDPHISNICSVHQTSILSDYFTVLKGNSSCEIHCACKTLHYDLAS